jgi:hypothetical protein
LQKGQALADAEKRFGIVPVSIGDMKPGDVMRDFTPNAIVVGCSSPAYQEYYFAIAANHEKVPLVIMSDIRRAWERHAGVDGLVLTTDVMDAHAAQAQGFTARAVGMHQANLPPADAETEEFVEASHRKGRAVVLAALSGQPSRVAQELECVLACSAMTSLSHTLVVQPNPKILPQEHPDGGTLADWFARTIGDKAVMLKGPFARYADMTISPSSGGLTALAAGHVGVGLRCKSVEDVLVAESGVIPRLDFYEQELGMPIIREPIDLAPLFAAPQSKVAVHAFDAQLALQHIKKFAGIA